MNARRNTWITLLSLMITIVLLACSFSFTPLTETPAPQPTPIPATPTPTNPLPGLPGNWQDLETGTIHTIAWQNNQFVVTAINDPFVGPLPITSQSWDGNRLTWTYYIANSQATITFTTIAVNSDDLFTNWSANSPEAGVSSGNETLQRVNSAQPGEVPDNILLYEVFSDPASGWNVGRFNYVNCAYRDGYYLITLKEKSILGDCRLTGQIYDNTTIEVDVAPFTGPANNNLAYGIACRQQENGDGYFFLISADGFYRVYVSSGSQETFTPLSGEWQTTAAIKQGYTPNHLSVTCDNSLLRLEVNGETLFEGDDTTFTQGGIALLTLPFEQVDANEVHFDELLVTVPLVPEPTYADLPYFDDFSRSSTGWENKQYESNGCKYQDGVYVTIVNVPFGVAACSNYKYLFTDATIDIAATPIEDPTGRAIAYGVSCRSQGNLDQYSFLITTTGQYAAIKSSGDGSSHQFLSGDDFQDSPAIDQGYVTNHLAVTCAGNYLRFEVNGWVVYQGYDPNGYAEGFLGLSTLANSEGAPLEVHYDNLAISAPELPSGVNLPIIEIDQDATLAVLQTDKYYPLDSLITNNYTQEQLVAAGRLYFPADLASIGTKPVFVGFNWCAADAAILQDNLSHIPYLDFYINGIAIDYTYNSYTITNSNSVCQYTGWLFSNWPSGNYQVQIDATYDAPIFDGWMTSDAGLHSIIYNIVVP